MDNRQFEQFGNPSNNVSRLLLAHFVALHIILAPILGRERQGRMISTDTESILDWLDKIHEEMSPSLRHFLDWPTTVATYVRQVKASHRGHD